METPKRVLVIQAHPDDADYHAGGTIKKFTNRGADVLYLTCTNGDKGTRDTSLTSQKLALRRRGEQKSANEILGVINTVFLDNPDGELKYDADLLSEVVLTIREFRPDTIITFDPDWPDAERHPDHHTVSLAAIRGAAFSGFHLYFPDQVEGGLIPHLVKRILLMNPRRPNRSSWIFRHHLDKIRAVLTHKSQMAYILDERGKGFSEKVIGGIPKIFVFFIFAFLDRSFIYERFRMIDGKRFLR